MAKDFAKSFYNTTAWLKAREEYIAERIIVDGGFCEECHQRLEYIVHHKEELAPDNINDPEITLGKRNFSYVCKTYHDKKEGHFLDSARAHRRKGQANYCFTSDGKIHPMMDAPLIVRGVVGLKTERPQVGRTYAIFSIKGGIKIDKKNKQAILDKIAEEMRPTIGKLLDDVDFMNLQIDKLKKTIGREGTVELFEQGKQKFQRQSSATATCLALMKQRDMTIGKIKDFIPKNVASDGADDDGFDAFVNGR